VTAHGVLIAYSIDNVLLLQGNAVNYMGIAVGMRISTAPYLLAAPWVCGRSIMFGSENFELADGYRISF
jgi:hypothetical protein